MRNVIEGVISISKNRSVPSNFNIFYYALCVLKAIKHHFSFDLELGDNYNVFPKYT